MIITKIKESLFSYLETGISFCVVKSLLLLYHRTHPLQRSQD